MKFSKELANQRAFVMERNSEIGKKIFIDGIPVIADFYGKSGNVEILLAERGDDTLVLRAWNSKNRVGAIGRICGNTGVLQADISISFKCVNSRFGMLLDFSEFFNNLESSQK